MVRTCDVCEEILEQPICPHCKFNNDYQFYDEGSADYLFLREIIEYVTYTPNCTVDDILEEFDISLSEFKRLVEEYGES